MRVTNGKVIIGELHKCQIEKSVSCRITPEHFMCCFMPTKLLALGPLETLSHNHGGHQPNDPAWTSWALECLKEKLPPQKWFDISPWQTTKAWKNTCTCIMWWGSTLSKAQKPADMDWKTQKHTVRSASQLPLRLLTRKAKHSLPSIQLAQASNLWHLAKRHLTAIKSFKS